MPGGNEVEVESNEGNRIRFGDAEYLYGTTRFNLETGVEDLQRTDRQSQPPSIDHHAKESEVNKCIKKQFNRRPCLCRCVRCHVA